MASTELPPYRLQEVELGSTAMASLNEIDPVPYPIFRLLVTVLCRRAHKAADTNLDGGIDRYALLGLCCGCSTRIY